MYKREFVYFEQKIFANFIWSAVYADEYIIGNYHLCINSAIKSGILTLFTCLIKSIARRVYGSSGNFAAYIIAVYVNVMVV